MQFSNASILPTVYTNLGDRDIRLNAMQVFPYVVVDGLPDSLQIKVNGHTAFIRYDGHQIRHPGQAVYGAALPAQIPVARTEQAPVSDSSKQLSGEHGAFRGELIFEEITVAPAAITQPPAPIPMLNQQAANSHGMTIRTSQEIRHTSDNRQGCDVRQYRVVHGDSAWKIAHENRIRLADLMRMNHLGRSAQIRVGQMIAIPVQDRTGQLSGACDQNQATALPIPVLPVARAATSLITGRPSAQTGMEQLSLHMSGNLFSEVRRGRNGIYRVNELTVR